MAGIDVAVLVRASVVIGETRRAAGQKRAADRVGVGVVFGQQLLQRGLPHVADAQPLAELHRPEGVDVDALGRAQVFIRARVELIRVMTGQPAGQPVRGAAAEPHRPALDRRAPGCGRLRLSVRSRGIDADHVDRQLQPPRRGDGGLGRCRGIAAVEAIVTQAEIRDIERHQRPQPGLGIFRRGRPVAVGDDAGLEPHGAGHSKALDHQGIEQEGLAALEVDPLHRSQPFGLLENLGNLGAGEGPLGSRTTVKKAVVAFEIAAIGQKEMDLPQHGVLHVARQAGGEAVDIDLVRVPALRLEEGRAGSGDPSEALHSSPR